MIKLIASDIDGTLVPDGTAKIDTRMFDIIKRLKAHGITYVGASGRQYASIARLFQPVAEDIIYIAEGGTLLRDSREIYNMQTIDRDHLMEMVRDVKKLPDCDIMLGSADTSYCEDKSEMFYWMRDSYRFNIKVLGDFETHLRDDIVKMSIYHKDNAEAIVNEWFTKKWEKHFKIASAGVMWMDITSPGADKGSALRLLQERMGITREETMAFGDNLNDMELIQGAAYSYAIGNARQEIKDAARYVAPPVSENGETTVLLKLLEELDS